MLWTKFLSHYSPASAATITKVCLAISHYNGSFTISAPCLPVWQICHVARWRARNEQAGVFWHFLNHYLVKKNYFLRINNSFFKNLISNIFYVRYWYLVIKMAQNVKIKVFADMFFCWRFSGVIRAVNWRFFILKTWQPCCVVSFGQRFFWTRRFFRFKGFLVCRQESASGIGS